MGPLTINILLSAFSLGCLFACIVIYNLTKARDRRIRNLCREVLEAQGKGHLLKIIDNDSNLRTKE